MDGEAPASSPWNDNDQEKYNQNKGEKSSTQGPIEARVGKVKALVVEPTRTEEASNNDLGLEAIPRAPRGHESVLTTSSIRALFPDLTRQLTDEDIALRTRQADMARYRSYGGLMGRDVNRSKGPKTLPGPRLSGDNVGEDPSLGSLGSDISFRHGLAEEPLDGMIPTETPEVPSKLDRWAEIRKNAQERAVRPASEREGSLRPKTRQLRAGDRDPDQTTEDEETSGEESIESRVARIKTRVAELTGQVAEQQTPNPQSEQKDRGIDFQNSTWKEGESSGKQPIEVGTLVADPTGTNEADNDSRPDTWADDFCKKNARFDIPAERNLANIEQLISQATGEEELTELKQQKRLLQNRQAALDSRDRKIRYMAENPHQREDGELETSAPENVSQDLEEEAAPNPLHLFVGYNTSGQRITPVVEDTESSPSRESSDNGSIYTNPGGLAQDDLSQPSQPSQPKARRERSDSFDGTEPSRPRSISGDNDLLSRAGDASELGPPPTTRGFDKILRNEKENPGGLSQDAIDKDGDTSKVESIESGVAELTENKDENNYTPSWADFLSKNQPQENELGSLDSSEEYFSDDEEEDNISPQLNNFDVGASGAKPSVSQSESPASNSIIPGSSQTSPSQHGPVIISQELVNSTTPLSFNAQQDRRSFQQASSYWSVPEQYDFAQLLEYYGTDWQAIANYMTTKTHIMVKNYYQRQVDSGKRQWEDITREANARKGRGETLPPLPSPTIIPKRRYNERSGNLPSPSSHPSPAQQTSTVQKNIRPRGPPLGYFSLETQQRPSLPGTSTDSSLPLRSLQVGREAQLERQSALRLEEEQKQRDQLEQKTPKENFSEAPYPSRGVVPLNGKKQDGVPPDARWSKFSRKIIDPEALERGKERYEVRGDFITVLRVLSTDEVQEYAKATRKIRAHGEGDEKGRGNDGRTEKTPTSTTVPSKISSLSNHFKRLTQEFTRRRQEFHRRDFEQRYSTILHLTRLEMDIDSLLKQCRLLDHAEFQLQSNEAHTPHQGSAAAVDEQQKQEILKKFESLLNDYYSTLLAAVAGQTISLPGESDTTAQAKFQWDSAFEDSTLRLGPDEVETLEQEFKTNRKPTSEQKLALSTALNVGLARVNNWFQNRRAKAKQEKRQAADEAGYEAEREDWGPFQRPESPEALANDGYLDNSQGEPAIPQQHIPLQQPRVPGIPQLNTQMQHPNYMAHSLEQHDAMAYQNYVQQQQRMPPNFGNARERVKDSRPNKSLLQGLNNEQGEKIAALPPEKLNEILAKRNEQRQGGLQDGNQDNGSKKRETRDIDPTFSTADSDRISGFHENSGSGQIHDRKDGERHGLRPISRQPSTSAQFGVETSTTPNRLPYIPVQPQSPPAGLWDSLKRSQMTINTPVEATPSEWSDSPPASFWASSINIPVEESPAPGGVSVSTTDVGVGLEVPIAVQDVPQSMNAHDTSAQDASAMAKGTEFTTIAVPSFVSTTREDDEISIPNSTHSTMSIVSIDSDFSLLSGLTGSSASSLQSSQDVIERLVVLFLDDEVIHPACSNALEIISRERFERNLRRLLKSFGVALRQEAVSDDQRHTARFVLHRATNSAHLICNKLQQTHKPKQTVVVEDEVDEPFEDSDSDHSENFDSLQHLEVFIKESSAMEALRRSLLEFVEQNTPRNVVSSTKLCPNEVLEATTEDDLPTLNDALPPTDSGTRSDPESKAMSMKVDVAYGGGSKFYYFPVSITLWSWIVATVNLPLDFIKAGRALDFGNSQLKENSISRWIQRLRHGKYARCLSSLLIELGLIRPPLVPGKKRIEWKCKCGHKVLDDFTETKPGAMERFRLERLIRNNQPKSKSTTSMTAGIFWNIFSNGRHSKEQVNENPPSTLPMHELRNTCIDSSSTSTPGSQPQLSTESLYLLLCYSDGSFGTRLLQIDLASKGAGCDKILFKLLRSNYQTMRGRFTSFLSFRTLGSIKFVSFELYSNSSQLVDVKNENVLPPPENRDYRYRPAPPEMIPPIGEKHMMHLFEHPDHAEEEPVCFDSFPKKLKEKLLCRDRSRPPGWGLQFVEVRHTRKICGLLFGIGSLLIGVLWSVYGHSIQDAFSMAGYMVAMAALALGTMQPLLVR